MLASTARADALEGDCSLMAKAPDGQFHALVDGSHLSDALSQSPVPPLALPSGYGDGYVECVRSDLIPVANDYKVLLLGYVLFIKVARPDGTYRTSLLEIDDGRIQLQTLKGAEPTDAELERGQKMTDALQSAIDAAPPFVPKKNP